MKKTNLFKRIYRWFKGLSGFKKAVLLLVLVAAAYFVKSYLFAAPPAPRYKTAKVKKGDIVDIVEASGPVNPVSTTNVGALVSGEILEILVDYNTVVKKGDLMAVIDQTQILADLEEARASLASAKEALQSAKLTYDLAKTNLTRYKDLYAKEYVSKSSLEEYELNFANAKSSLNSAQSRVVQAQATLDRSEKDLSNTKIVSPIDGVVLSKKVSVGQTITSGFSTPELFVVAEDLTKMQIEAKVSEADIVKIKAGQTAEFTLDGYVGEKFKGKVRQVRTNYVDTSSSSSSSGSSTTYTVVIDVDNEDLRLMPGMTATITVRTTDKKDVLLVPNEALRFSPSTNEEKYDTTGVWTLEPGQEPKRVDVTIGIIDTKRTEITGGELEAGDVVITGETKVKAQTSASMQPPRPGRRR